MKSLTQKSISINDHELVYYEAGEGTPILFIHGISTYSFIWRKIVPYFLREYRVIVVDLFGCGNSDKRIDISYSIENHAGYMNILMGQLGITKYHLVGHDVGGGIVQIMSVKYPEKILTTTMINTVAYDFWPVQPIIAMRTPFLRQLAVATLDIWTFKSIIKRGLFHNSSYTPELIELFKKGISTKESRKSFLHFAACLDNCNLMDIAEELHNSEMPYLVIRGASDAYLSTAITQKLVDNLKNVKSLVIPTAGHYAQEDEPEIINREIYQFIKLHE